MSSDVVPCAPRRWSSQSNAGVTARSCSRSRWTSCTAKAVTSGALSIAREAPRVRRHGPVVADAEQLVGQRVGFLSHRAPANDALGQAPEVLHEHDA